jgi:glc operon protein GlcG
MPLGSSSRPGAGEPYHYIVSAPTMPHLASIRTLSVDHRTYPNLVAVPFIWQIQKSIDSILRMRKLLLVTLSFLTAFPPVFATDFPTKKYLNLASIKIMVAAAEAEAQKRNVEVTICVVDDSGNLLFLEKADGASLGTIQFAQKKARHAAAYGSPSKDAADYVKKGSVEALSFPDFFPNQGGLPIKVDGKTIGGIAASGAKSEIDEGIAQAALDALFKK